MEDSMDKKFSNALDRHITGNYGEDQYKGMPKEEDIIGTLTGRGWKCECCEGPEDGIYFDFLVLIYRHFQWFHRFPLESFSCHDNFIVRKPDGGPF
jgi:hypothetical protein